MVTDAGGAAPDGRTSPVRFVRPSAVCTMVASIPSPVRSSITGVPWSKLPRSRTACSLAIAIAVRP